MKRKISKILGVALTLVMVLSLAAFFMPATTPAAQADPAANKWTKFVTPVEGSDGDYMVDNAISFGPGRLEMGIDGTFWAYARIEGDANVMKSDDARSWEKTDYYDDVADVNNDSIIDIVPSSIDADIVYVTDGEDIFKTENGGDKWVTLSSLYSEGNYPNAGNITSLDIGYIDSAAYIIVGTDGSGGYIGGVFIAEESAWGMPWADTALAGDHGYGSDNVTVLDVAASPDFEVDQMMIAVFTETETVWTDPYADLTGTTWASTKYGGQMWSATVAADWFLPDGPDPTSYIAMDADIWLPDDFDSDDESGKMEYYVGIDGDETGLGDVYRVVVENIFDRDINGQPFSESDITGLDGTGGVGNPQMLAARRVPAASAPNSVTHIKMYYSDAPGGASWDYADKDPTGEVLGYPVVANNFRGGDEGEAWVACRGSEGAVSYTRDGGELFNQIGLIDTELNYILDFEPSPNYAEDGIVFMVTSRSNPWNSWGPIYGESLWILYDGDYWERTLHVSLYGSGPQNWWISDVECSPDFAGDNTVVFADRVANYGWRSRDGGGLFRKALGSPTTDDIYNWLVVDGSTRVVGTTNGDVWYTTNNGTTWKDADVGPNAIMFLALDPNDPDNMLASDDKGKVYLSTDAAETWDQVPVGAAVEGTDASAIAFDPNYAENNLIYATDMGGDVYKLNVGSDTSWKRHSGLYHGAFPQTANLSPDSGYNMVIGDDGILYVVDLQAPTVARCHNPTAAVDRSPVDAPYYEAMGKDWPSGDMPYGLWLTPGGSNVLWTINLLKSEVWGYEDTIVAPKLSSPKDGTDTGKMTQVSLSWGRVSGALKYYIQYDEDPGFPMAKNLVEDYFATPASISYTIRDLIPGITYYWRVCVKEGARVLSPFSETWSFTTGLPGEEWNPFVTATFTPGNVAPTSGATDVPLVPNFQWNAADWATGYEFQLSSNAAFAQPIVSRTGANALETTAYMSEKKLEYITTYYWRVRAISKTSNSPWATGVFTTMAEPVAPPAPPPPQPPAPVPDILTQAPVYLWTIIAIGAVLVIAVIVLIVRTRRIT